jgi:hypothetical protein
VTDSKIAIRAGAALAALLSLLTICGTSFAAASSFNIYYSGAENLVLKRLQLDPTSNRVDSLAGADAAVYQGTLPSRGPDLDLLKARVAAGMGLVVIIGKDTDPKALAALTDGRVEQTGGVDVAPGPEHDIELERIAAVINYIGPPRDPIATNIGWLSAVRIHERTLLDTHGAEVMVRTNPYDPIKPKTPILLRLHLGKGTIFVLNV